MSLKNWKVTCHLLSPLCGDPPMIDALMEYELSVRLGMKYARKLTRSIPLSIIDRPPIPVSRRTLSGIDYYCSSNPILGNVNAEYTERHAKRFDTDMCALLLDQKSSSTMLLTSSGPYKSRFVKKRVRLVDTVTWFVRGDRKEMNKLLKKFVALGHCRGYGYGFIDRWEYEEQPSDYSIFAPHNGGRVLMRTVAFEAARDSTGYRKSFGGAFPPYWHPDTFMDIAVPC